MSWRFRFPFSGSDSVSSHLASSKVYTSADHLLTISSSASVSIISIMSSNPTGNPQGNATANPNGTFRANLNGNQNGNDIPKSHPALMPNGKPYIPAPPARIHTKEDAEFLQSLHRRAQAIRDA